MEVVEAFVIKSGLSGLRPTKVHVWFSQMHKNPAGNTVDNP